MKNGAETDINKVDSERYSATFLDHRVRVLIGDITRQDVDAIVNAANSSLLGGGGVDGAIHRAGGPQILEQCREIRRTQFPDGLPTGEAVMTGGGLLAARHVIHTVGPIYGREAGREEELLTSCYQNSLALAAQHGIESVAFPSISTGAFGYPKAAAVSVSSTAIASFLKSNHSIKEVRLVFFSQPDVQTFLKNHRLDER
ncbi:MAG: O-acetyl-ADP-ribose deacetylase [Acidobacteriota bacterium]|nr:O-acetyl-ADP-ribose deacetylase [Acidobacteriota bacterium]